MTNREKKEKNRKRMAKKTRKQLQKKGLHKKKT
jgi:hypothetical protein